MADDHIRSALEGPLADHGLVLDDLTITPAGRRRVVRVVVDSDLGALAPDDATSRVAPLTLDAVADATRLVSAVLDGTHGIDDDAPAGADLMGSAPYTLEVSSPGVDRSLRGYRPFRRNVGRLVAVVLETGDTFTGRIVSVSGDLVVLEEPATKKTAAVTREIAVDDVTSAKVQVEFGRAPEPVAGDESADEHDESADEHDDDTDDEHDDTDHPEETDDGH